MKSKRLLTILACIVSLAFILKPVPVFAADAAVIFGSDSYENENGSEFPVGVYINGDNDIGYYRVEISYDPQRLEYIDGASGSENGIIVFDGNGASENVSTMLYFRALSGGESELSISRAMVRVAGSDGEEFNLTELAKVPISINGEDTVTASTAETESASEEKENSSSEDPNVSETETSETAASEKNENGNALSSFRNSDAFFPVVIILPLAGVLAAIIGILAARKKIRKKRLRKEYAQKFNDKQAVSRQITPEQDPQKPTAAGQDAKKQDASGKDDKKQDDAGQDDKKQDAPGKDDKKQDASGQDDKKQDAHGKDDKKQDIDVKTPAAEPAVIEKAEISAEPVIQVKNVSMNFKVSNSSSSGLKDYMIQKVKGKVKYRQLKALDDISFDVYKGEVVGIIGTNGSGKSTLLKIVSGALRPSNGEVITDMRKVQLLTLGTGFDGELSARENVYLNGAIIGYTKDFIDKHYDEIVEFAELQDFMDEKVKNFSSGMVSRLGFSIATVAGAAEILILDEVLSVGDQFFRKKSLDRIKQMIHGGSTVLIVSHGMSTIKEHCTKVVWIEKGKLRMIGDPKDVCEAYANQLNEIKANENGELAYYVEGTLQRDYSGYVKNAKGDAIIVKNGIIDTSYTFAKWVDKNLLFFDKGVLNKKYTGIASTEAKSKVYFKDGVFQNKFCGVLEDADGRFLYFSKGTFDPKFSGEKDGYKIEKGIASKIRK